MRRSSAGVCLDRNKAGVEFVEVFEERAHLESPVPADLLHLFIGGPYGVISLARVGVVTRARLVAPRDVGVSLPGVDPRFQ